ncbi:MAG: DUF349 domain-containing protein, partial [Tidjanibacter sp.]|nr:DUF349 domain-containing protein [Tidjanibacter sp.]
MTTENQNPVPEEQVGVAEDVNVATQEPATQEVVAEQTQPAEEAAVQEESVSFEDEEAASAAEAPEFTLENDEINEESGEEVSSRIADSVADLAAMSKSEVVDYFANLLETKPVQSMRYDVEAVKVAFYKHHRADVEAARKAFVEQGGVAEDFHPEVDVQEVRLKEYFGVYRTRREEYMASLESLKEENLKVKLQIIEELKELISSNETMNHTFQTFRDLQQRWKETGVVPQANVKEIWETYNLHVENFYN